ncbi:MAG: hypothetical protein ACJ8AW_14000, partial [Rhodopila sp.]
HYKQILKTIKYEAQMGSRMRKLNCSKYGRGGHRLPAYFRYYGATATDLSIQHAKQGHAATGLSGCDTPLALSAVRRALVMSQGPACPAGLSLANAGLAVSRSATT